MRFVNLHTDCRAANRGPRRSTYYFFFLFLFGPFQHRVEAGKRCEMNEHRGFIFRGVSLTKKCTLKGVYRVFSSVFFLTGSEAQRSVSVETEYPAL